MKRYNKAIAGGGVSLICVATLIQILARRWGIEIDGELSLLLAGLVGGVVSLVIYYVPNLHEPGELLILAARQIGFQLNPAQAEALWATLLKELQDVGNKQ